MILLKLIKKKIHIIIGKVIYKEVDYYNKYIINIKYNIFIKNQLMIMHRTRILLLNFILISLIRVKEQQFHLLYISFS